MVKWLSQVRNKSRKVWKKSCLVMNMSSICNQKPYFNNTQSPNYSYFCMKQDQNTLQRLWKISSGKKGNSQVKSGTIQVKSRICQIFKFKNPYFSQILKALIEATFVWNMIKKSYRDNGNQVKSSKEQVKSCWQQSKLSQEQVRYSHSKSIKFFLPILKAQITATFVWNKIKTHYRDNLSQVMNKSSQVINNSCQVKNLSRIHIQRQLFFFTNNQTLITATYEWNKII